MATDTLNQINLARTNWSGIHYAASAAYRRNTAADFKDLYR